MGNDREVPCALLPAAFYILHLGTIHKNEENMYLEADPPAASVDRYLVTGGVPMIRVRVLPSDI